jgi:hypothetical protein
MNLFGFMGKQPASNTYQVSYLLVAGGGGSGSNWGGGGGGGNGAFTNPSNGNPGTPNTGGGAGGGSGNDGQGASGGSGVFILSYISPIQLGTGGTITNYTDGQGKHWVHTFTASGNYTA